MKPGKVHIPLLLFLAAAIYASISVKVLAVLVFFVYLLWTRASWRGVFRAPVLFYLLMPLVGFAGAWYSHAFSDPRYPFVFLWGLAYWLLPAAVLGSLLVMVRKTDAVVLTRTIKVFFLLNGICTLLQLLRVMYLSGSLMPYYLNDAVSIYGTSTGDHMPGIFGTHSLANAAINGLGVVYFLFSGSWRWAVLCLLVLILCTSNAVLLLVTGALLLAMLLGGQPGVRRGAALLLAGGLLGYAALSPRNVYYSAVTFRDKIFSSPPAVSGLQQDGAALAHLQAQALALGYTAYASCTVPRDEDSMKWILPELQKAPGFTGRNGLEDSGAGSALGTYWMRRWYGVPADSSVPALSHATGKKLSLRQTTAWLVADGPLRLMAGAGPGNFSSRLALKASGLGIAGRFPAGREYLSPDFFLYHLHAYLYVYSLPAAEHSILQFPSSAFNQLAGEYGLAGVLLFLCLYVFWWLRRGNGSAGFRLCMTGLLLALLGLDYWMEMISLTVVFELLMLTDQKRTTTSNDE